MSAADARWIVAAGYPSSAELRERIKVRERVRAALGCDGKSARAALIDADARRELQCAWNRESRARLSESRERLTWRSERARRQLVMLAAIPTLDLEHLVHGEQLEQLATIEGWWWR